MALITQLTKCALCHELIGDAKIVATANFIGDPKDPLWRFADGQTSLILHGKRELSKANTHTIADRFKVSAALFFGQKIL